MERRRCLLALELEALFLSHRLSDEEIIERAFKTALEKHFPKPGPITVERFPSGTEREIVEGQIWEMWCRVENVGDLLVLAYCPRSYRPLTRPHIVVDQGTMSHEWHPIKVNVLPDYVTGWAPSGSPTRYDADVTAVGTMNYEISPFGYLIFGPGLLVNEDQDVIMMMRRRFDLET